MAVMN